MPPTNETQQENPHRAWYKQKSTLKFAGKVTSRDPIREEDYSQNSSSKTNIPKGRKTERGKKEKESANEAETDYRHSLVAAINGHG